MKSTGLRDHFPGRRLVAFADRGDCDDVACWDLDRSKVSIIHDYTDSGWEQVAEFDDFVSWLQHAFDEFLEFGRENDWEG